MQKGGFEFEPSFFYRLISKFILIQPLFYKKKVNKVMEYTIYTLNIKVKVIEILRNYN